MDFMLTDTEVRVLGCLIEKEFSTPEYYPLSLNALVNACNQKSNRDPVVGYDEKTVLASLEGLRHKQLVLQSNVGRVTKYEETLLKVHNFVGREASVLCELMVRGPQTTGELRSRAERMHSFASLEEIGDVLADLESLGYVVRLARQPGRKEARYAHLFSGMPREDAESAPSSHEQAPAGDHTDNARIAALEEKVITLERALEEMQRAFGDFKRQFE
jgi:hypothetical protein